MTSDLQITVLVNNEAGPGLMAEHGLPFWIETSGTRILFDTGQGLALAPNVRRLGIAIEQTDVIVLSHGHYDHSDGLPEVLSLVPEARLIVHPDALTPRYSIHPGRSAKAVGISAAARAAIGQVPAERITWSDRPISIAAGVGVTGPIARQTSFEDVGGPFFLDADGTQADPLTDDQALWIDTPEGRIVCLGCAHAGLINTLEAVERLSRAARTRAVIGGFHLLNAGEDRLEQTLDALRAMGPEVLVPCHCTGGKAIARLQAAFGEQVRTCQAGMKFGIGLDL